MKRPRNNTGKLTPDDRDIWRRVTNTAQPLSMKGRNFREFLGDEADNDPRNDEYPAGGKSETGLSKRLRNSAATVYQPSPKLNQPQAPGQLDASTSRKLSKGKIAIGGSLDLHGFTQTDAYSMLYHFLEDAYYNGKRVVLVITGKGNFGQGVLRANVPIWLEDAKFRKLVSAFDNAHSTHGGAGALYVRLRRYRGKQGY